MRALTLRRTAFVATLVTGLSLTGSAVHGVSRVDTTLQLAADTTRERPAFVSERPGLFSDHPRRECDERRDPARRV